MAPWQRRRPSGRQLRTIIWLAVLIVCSVIESDAQPKTATATATDHPRPQRPNFLLITIDSLRPDRLGSYGYPRPTSPQLDSFAAGAVRFERAYAQAPHTPRSMPSFLTSKMPSRVQWVKSFANYPALRPSNVTFFEVLQTAGYHTAAVVKHHYFNRERNVTQGIVDLSNANPGTIADSNEAITAPELVPRAQERLSTFASTGRQFALWLHLTEPHARYKVHAGSPSFGSEPSDRYDGEIAFVDRHLGQLLQHLRKVGLWDNTAVVVFSDHGEAFWEHGHCCHGQTLYEEALRVPLLVRVPGLAPRAVAEPVALLDLFPTICELAGIAVPPDLEGRSLLPLLRGRRDPMAERRLIRAELLPYPNLDDHQVAILNGRYKLIHRVKVRTNELFALDRDPDETRNLWGQDSEATGLMAKILSAER